MEDYGTGTVLLITAVGSYVILGIVVARQALERGGGLGAALLAFVAWPVVLLLSARKRDKEHEG